MRRPEDKISSRFVWDLMNRIIHSKGIYSRLGIKTKYQIWEAMCCEFGIFEDEGVTDPQERMVV